VPLFLGALKFLLIAKLTHGPLKVSCFAELV
jgi:hypothetical protein